MKPSLHEIWWRLHILAWRFSAWQALYSAILRLRNAKLYRNLANNKSQLVIEAFPRSANTFLFHAVSLSSLRPILIAHHLHDVIQIDRGIELGIPVVVAVRDPVSAFVSYRMKSPHLSVSVMHSIYTSFYKRVLDRSDNILLVRYEDVIHKTDEVVGEILDRLGVQAAQRRHVGAETIFSAIDEAKSKREKTKPSPGSQFSTTVARPTAEKDALRAQAETDMLKSNYEHCQKARAIYAKLLPLCHEF